jgi:hypothetical protein
MLLTKDREWEKMLEWPIFFIFHHSNKFFYHHKNFQTYEPVPQAKTKEFTSSNVGSATINNTTSGHNKLTQLTA